MTEKRIEEIRVMAESHFVMDADSLHGFDHWKRVHDNGVLLASQSGVDLAVVRLFAWLHDCKRVEDWEDPEHGQRSASLVMEMKDTLFSWLDVDQKRKLWYACYHHNIGTVSEDITIGACFDADRLELVRCGVMPREDLMSTPMGKHIAHLMNRGHLLVKAV